GAWPQVPAARDSSADLDTGIGERADRSGYGDTPGADDLGVDGGDGLDLGISAGSGAPTRGSSPGANGRAGASRTPESRATRFSRGQRVRHADYGAGTVVVSSFAGSEELVLVSFDTRPDKP